MSSFNTLYKIGGSLLNWSLLPERLEQFVATHDAATQPDSIRPIFLVGGGSVANVVRDWDRTFSSLDDKAAHHLALHSLSLTEMLLMKLISRFVLVNSFDQITELRAELPAEPQTPLLQTPPWALIQTSGWLERASQHANEEILKRLPENWSVTSDSIAAAIAASLNIETLVLLKSTDYPEADQAVSISEASEKGLLDVHFPTLIAEIQKQQPFTVKWLNLRDENSNMVIISKSF